MINSSNENPKISVVVPVYNVQDYLRECLASLEAQTYKNLEILLVDDGSTDASGKICDEYAIRDSRFRVFHNNNQGVAGARNFALNYATGEFVGFVDSDDKCELTMFESLVKAANKFRADIVFGAKSTWFVNEIKQNKRPVKCNTLVSQKEFLEAIFSLGEWQSTAVAGGFTVLKLFKREVIEGIKFADTKVYCEDELYCASACLKAQTICCIDDNLYFYRQRQNSLVRDSSFAIKRLKGRLEVNRLVETITPTSTLITTSQESVIRALVSATRYWEPKMKTEDKDLLVETAKRFLPMARVLGDFKCVAYIWIMTKPVGIKDIVFSVRRYFSKSSRSGSKQLFD